MSLVQRVSFIMVLMAVVTGAWAEDPAEITRLKEMHLSTQLVADGQAACVIAAPDTPEYLALAGVLARGIEQAMGVAPPVPGSRQTPHPAADCSTTKRCSGAAAR